MKNFLLVYPEVPPSYWSEKYALEFINKRSALPPLGLLTVAALFPDCYQLRLVDMNVQSLTDQDLEWSDAVFISAMVVQQKSFAAVVQRCRAMMKPVVAGGPYPTSFYDEIEGVDHLVLGEVENYFGRFLEDFTSGVAAPIYWPPTGQQGEPSRPDITTVPPPRYDLIDATHYGSLALQFSRGCPYNCEFCDITKLFGHVPRTKTNEQIIGELEVLYELGWRDSVFMVDDNFIGNRKSVLRLLPAIAAWQRERGYPFSFYTEASVNLADQPDLLQGMAAAGFSMVFLGIETPDAQVLAQTRKHHNVKQADPDYMAAAVRLIQQHGMEVSAGFIVGLDGDDENVFDRQFDFIQRTGIPTAMVGLLNALKGTDLYTRLQAEGRILKESAGDNVSMALNFLPEMDAAALVARYKLLLTRLYDASLHNYFERCYTLIRNWNRTSFSGRSFRWMELVAFLRTLKRQLPSRQGWPYLKFLGRVLLRRPRLLTEAVRLSIMGYHYQLVTQQQILIDEFRHFLEDETRSLQKYLKKVSACGSSGYGEWQRCLREHRRVIERRYRRIHKDFRGLVDEALNSFWETHGFPRPALEQGFFVPNIKSLSVVSLFRLW